MQLVLQLTLTQFNVEKVKILQCSFGKLNAVSVKLEINNGFRVAKPLINRLLTDKPINFPTQVGNLFKLEALTLSYYDDYVYAGITPVFIGPTSAAKPEPTFDTNSYQVEYVRQERLSVDSATGEETLTISYVEVLDEMVQF